MDEAQRQERRKGIGGSDLAAILGLHPYVTPTDVWNDKVSGVEVEETARMRLGTFMEHTMAAMYRDSHPGHRLLAACEASGDQWYRRVDRYHNLMRGTIDGIVEIDGVKGIWECKTVRKMADQVDRETGLPMWEGGRLPLHYWVQQQHYMRLWGYEYSVLTALDFATAEEHEFVTEFDEEFAKKAWKRAEEWWRTHVEGHTPPAPSEDDHSWARKAFPEDNASPVTCDPDTLLVLDDLRDARTRRKDLDHEIANLTEKVQRKLGEGAMLVNAGGHVVATWKTQQRKSIDVRALREAHPDIVAQFQKTSTSRVFRLKELTESDD